MRCFCLPKWGGSVLTRRRLIRDSVCYLCKSRPSAKSGIRQLSGPEANHRDTETQRTGPLRFFWPLWLNHMPLKFEVML